MLTFLKGLIERREFKALVVAGVMAGLAHWVLPLIPNYQIDAAFVERMVELGLALVAGFTVEGLGKADYKGAFAALLGSSKFKAYLAGLLALALNAVLGLFDLAISEADMSALLLLFIAVIGGKGALDFLKVSIKG